MGGRGVGGTVGDGGTVGGRGVRVRDGVGDSVGVGEMVGVGDTEGVGVLVRVGVGVGEGVLVGVGVGGVEEIIAIKRSVARATDVRSATAPWARSYWSARSAKTAIAAKPSNSTSIITRKGMGLLRLSRLFRAIDANSSTGSARCQFVLCNRQSAADALWHNLLAIATGEDNMSSPVFCVSMNLAKATNPS